MKNTKLALKSWGLEMLGRYFKQIRLVTMISVIICSLFSTIIIGQFTNQANSLDVGNYVLRNGISTDTRDVGSFIAQVESQGGVGAAAIISRLSQGGTGNWKENLALVTRIEYVGGYSISQTSNILNGSYQFGNLVNSQTADVLIFYIGSSVYFIIDTLCGNFITEPIPSAIGWDLNATTTARTSTVNNVTETTVGTDIIWTHTLTNKGPSDTGSGGISSHSEGSGGAPTDSNISSPPHIPRGGVVRQYEIRYKPIAVGRVCEQLLYTPANSNGGHWHGEQVCVNVIAAKNSITATSTVSQATAVPGNSITWQHQVDNAGPDATTEPIRSYISPSGFSSGVNIYDQTTASGVAAGVVRRFNSDTYIVKDSDVGKTLCQSVRYSAVGGTQSGSSTPACVTIKQMSITDPCRPIQIYTVPERTHYDKVTHTDPWNRSYSSPAVDISTVARINGNIIYTNSTTQPYTLDKPYLTNYITTKYTDGDSHIIMYNEASSHIAGYTDHYKTVYDYGWINDPPKWVSGSWSTGKPPVYTPGHYVPSGTKHWGVIGSHLEYNGSTTSYSAGPASKGSQSFGPCYDYKLEANMNSFGNKVEAGASISVNATVSNTPFTQPSKFYSYYHTSSKSHSSSWQVSLLKLSPGQMPGSSFSKSKIQNNTSACNYFDPAGAYSCSSYSSGNSIFWPGSSSATNISFNVPDVLAGTKYCFAFSVNDPGNLDMSQKWSHASFSYASNCVVVVKKPKVQVWGGDLYVGRGSSTPSKIQTSQSLIQNKIYGSWGEYGLVASSTITGMASGSVFKNAPTATGNNCDYSKLTITSAGASVCVNSTPKGNYLNSKLIPNVTASFLSSPIISSISGDVDVSSLFGVYKNSSTYIKINGSSTPMKKWAVINAPDATVKISGDIKYDTTSTIKKLGDIPQLVIIARDIEIDNNVTQIDSWLVASGSINTCSAANITHASLKTSKCDRQLRINGPVMAGKLYLHRTAGAEPNGHTGDPAEVINMKADAYLWSYARASENSSSITSTYNNEMPIRF